MHRTWILPVNWFTAHLIANKMSEHLLSTYCTSGIRLSLLGVLALTSHTTLFGRDYYLLLKMRGAEIKLRKPKA